MPTYRIADLLVEMNCTGERLLRQAAPYLVSPTDPPAGEPDIVLQIPEEGIRANVEKYPNLNRDSWEYMMYGTAFYCRLLRFDGMMLHASAVVVGDYAYLFSANPGTGKSTHTQLWLRMLGDRAYILNDDKPAVREIDGRFYAYGTPFSGKTDLNRNARVKLGGICFLSRAKENRVEPIDPAAAVPLLFEQTVRQLPVRNMDRLLTRMDRLLRAVPLWQMGCNMEESAARLSYETMRSAAR